MFNQVSGLRFVTEPDKTTLASTGSNQTFTWKLYLTKQEKSKNLQVQFGTWDVVDNHADQYLIAIDQKPSVQESVWKANESIAKRLYWAGELKHDYFVSFTLFNVKPSDSGDYGIRFRVEDFPARILHGWFTLDVQVRNDFCYFSYY